MEQIQKKLIDTALHWRAVMDSGDVSKSEQKAFEAWLAADPAHKEAYAQAERFWTGLGAMAHSESAAPISAHQTATEKMTWPHRLAWPLRAIQQFIGARPQATLAGLMASLLIIGTLSVFYLEDAPAPYQHPTERFQTAQGEIRTIQLADGSELTLGAQSRVDLSYDRDQRRANLLSGDAYFKVEPDTERPFLVKAGDMTVRVTGTSFAVRHKPSTTHVAVAEGNVQVSYPLVLRTSKRASTGTASALTPSGLRTSQHLAAGQHVSASRHEGLGRAETINKNMIAAWRTKRLVYFDAPLQEVIEDINRYQDRLVILEDDRLKTLTVSISFDIQDVSGMLTSLSEAFDLSLDSSHPGSIRISSRD
ncbi:FecR family protein [Paremcibacter congregatus]|uniref:FecR family protein n=1 Tax=Paremcibacter congregatus TaxID=2043170 RepID=UPI003A8EBBF3